MRYYTNNLFLYQYETYYEFVERKSKLKSVVHEFEFETLSLLYTELKEDKLCFTSDSSTLVAHAWLSEAQSGRNYLMWKINQASRTTERSSISFKTTSMLTL